MNNTKEIIRVLGFIQEYFDNHADEQEPDARKELFRDWAEITLDAITLLKAQEPVLAVKLQSKKYIGRTGIAYDGSCGNCNSYLMRGWKSCPLCGKAVKWE